MQISTGLPRPEPLALCTLEAQKVTTEGVYRLPHAIYYCSQTPHELPAGTASKRIIIAQPNN